MSRWVLFALVPVVIAAVYLALLFVAQRSMLYPVPSPVIDPGPEAEPVRVAMDDGEAHGYFLPPLHGDGPAPLLMFMHGNGELAAYWAGEFDEPRRWGFGVLLVEYPGYGGAPGSPSEKSITDAAVALFDWAAGDPRIDGGQIVAYGRSLGGGAAVRLAVNRPAAALVLESAFTSVADFAARFMAPAFLIRDPFDSRRTLPHYKGPLLVLHGRQDTIVPIAQGRELAGLVPGARFVELDCGHNDCDRPWSALSSFLETAGVLPLP